MARNTNILIVDDDPLLMLGMRKLLIRAGFQVIEAATGGEGLAAARARQPDVILLDVVLPDLDGRDICRTLKKDPLTADISIIIISGHRITSDDQAVGLEIGADDYIARPVENRVLLARIEAVLRLRRAERELARHRDHLEELVQQRTAELKQEIAERKAAEKALREGEEKYRNMMEAMTDAAYIVSTDYQIEYTNQRMIRQLGRQPGREPCYEAIFNRDSPCAWCVLDQVRTGEHLVYEIPHPGDSRYFSVTNSPIHRSDNIVSMLSVFRDLTERRAMEARLRNASKMESIGTLVGGVAHDFNNILYTITGNTELAIEDVPEWHSAHYHLQEIKQASLRAAGIVKQLLTFCRKTDRDLAPVCVNPIIREALDFMRSTLPATIRLNRELPETDISILGDPVQIHQVLVNIGTNAFQAMEETGGTLDIRAETMDLDEAAADEFPDLPPGTYLSITIRDTGPGIDPTIIEHIFDPYFTTRDTGQGSGMGLATVHGIVKNHSGTVNVRSRPGKGASFTVLIPVHASDTDHAQDSAKTVVGGSERILFVDDEPAIGRMAGQILERLGYHVTVQSDPLLTLETFRSDPRSFDLVLSDMTMPGMNGVTLAGKIREYRSDTPVIICTGYSCLIDEKKAKSMGINALVMKPIRKALLARSIRQVLDA